MQSVLKDWIPVVAVLSGALTAMASGVLTWLLSQLGQYFIFRRERQKAVFRTLSLMLEIRYRILAMPEAIRQLSDALPIPPADQVILLSWAENFFLLDDGFAKEFETCIATVAEHDPILAFRLEEANPADYRFPSNFAPEPCCRPCPG
jgi:hypothetical protein